MASTYSPNLRLELIGTGEQQGTWGATTNVNLGTLLEEAIGGYTSVTVSDVADTTLTTNNGSADQSRNMVINLTGTLTGSRNVICPAVEKLYVVKNATSGGFAVTFKVSGQTGVSVPNGTTAFLYVDGVDARAINGSIASQNANNVAITGGTITGITDLAVADGGTGASTAANARTNLGLAIGTNVQAYDATLQSISALGTAADKYAYTTGVDTWAEGTITAAGRAILDDADAATQRSTLGLGALSTLNTVGTSQIDDNSVTGAKIALGSDAQGDIMYYNGTDWARLGAGSAGQLLKTNGAAANPTWASAITQATAVAPTSGTSIDFTGIPSWARKITIMFSQVSTNGSDTLRIQIGDTGGIETTGYSGSSLSIAGGGQSITASTSGIFISSGADTSSVSRTGSIVLANLSGNLWVANGGISYPEISRQCIVFYSKTLSDVLTQVRVTTTSGTDTFDAGAINIMYE